MSEPQIRKPKQSFWTTIRIGWGPYRRLFAYAMPYKMRLTVGLGFGFLAGFITSLMPLVLSSVASVVFHGATPSPSTLATHPELMDKGPPINSLILLCLAIPAVMIARSLCGYVNTYYMTWVSAKVLTDITNSLARC
jgi:ABC-type multidrug transport system fused ATPase/permease subunit